MPTSIGATMGKEIILDYLKEKSNDGVIEFLKEQKQALSKTGYSLDKELVPLIIKLIKNSSGKVRYNAVLLVSGIQFCMDAKNFHDMCKIAADNSRDMDGNVRQACFFLIKRLNAWLIAMPLIGLTKTMKMQR